MNCDERSHFLESGRNSDVSICSLGKSFSFKSCPSHFSVRELNCNGLDITGLQTDLVSPGAAGGGDETAAPAESDSCSGLFKLEMPEEKREVSGASAVTRVKCV